MSVTSDVPAEAHEPEAGRTTNPIELGEEVSPADEKRIIDAFLSADPPEPDTTVIEINSWRKKYGVPLRLTLRELTDDEIGDIMDMFTGSQGNRAARRSGGASAIRRPQEMSAHIVARALVSPDLSAADMPIYMVLKQRIKPLELQQAAEVVLEMSGGGEDAITIVKNSPGAED